MLLLPLANIYYYCITTTLTDNTRRRVKCCRRRRRRCSSSSLTYAACLLVFATAILSTPSSLALTELFSSSPSQQQQQPQFISPEFNPYDLLPVNSPYNNEVVLSARQQQQQQQQQSPYWSSLLNVPRSHQQQQQQQFTPSLTPAFLHKPQSAAAAQLLLLGPDHILNVPTLTASGGIAYLTELHHQQQQQQTHTHQQQQQQQPPPPSLLGPAKSFPKSVEPEYQGAINDALQQHQQQEAEQLQELHQAQAQQSPLPLQQQSQQQQAGGGTSITQRPFPFDTLAPPPSPLLPRIGVAPLHSHHFGAPILSALSPQHLASAGLSPHHPQSLLHDVWHPAAVQHRLAWSVATTASPSLPTTGEPQFDNQNNNNNNYGASSPATNFAAPPPFPPGPNNNINNFAPLSPAALAAANAAFIAGHPSVQLHDLISALMDPHNREVAVMLLSLMTMASNTMPAFGTNQLNSNSINVNHHGGMIAQPLVAAPPSPVGNRLDISSSSSSAVVMSDAVADQQQQQQQHHHHKSASLFYAPLAPAHQHPTTTNVQQQQQNRAALESNSQQQQLRQRHHLMTAASPSTNEVAQIPTGAKKTSLTAQQQQQQRGSDGTSGGNVGGQATSAKLSQPVAALQAAQATNAGSIVSAAAAAAAAAAIVNGGAMRAAAGGVFPTPCDQLAAQTPGMVIDPNQQYCTLPGAAYPTSTMSNYIVENLSLMKRMSGSPRVPSREEDADRSMQMNDGQDQRKKRLAGTGAGTRGKYLCPATEELVTPFWANNATGARLTIVNSPPFEQAVHTVKCTRGAQGRCHPTRPCWCTQEYSWFRLLAYDPTNDCKGIFMEWFKFPSSCNCMCY